jgi:filamentous hemagglutinin
MAPASSSERTERMVQGHQDPRGVADRAVPPRDRTIDPGQAAALESARLRALAPSTDARPTGARPELQAFEAFSRQYGQLEKERHVWRFARPDGSAYETSWTGLGTGSTAQAWARQTGHRVVGEVVSGPAETPFTPPPLIAAEPRIDDTQRGTANRLAAPPWRPPKRNVVRPVPPSIVGSPRSARLLDPPQMEVFAPGPALGGAYANTALTREQRERKLALDHPAFALWLKFTLTKTVVNFQVNLGVPQNDDTLLAVAGIIFPGQSADDRGTVRGNGSQQNAFRHTFGQAIITREFGRQLAIEAGYAHEDLPVIDTTRRSFKPAPTPGNALFEADTVADQLNNEIGRRIAERLGAGASNLDLARAVLREFRDEGLYVATFDVPGEVRLSRQPLTPAEFARMMRLLKTLKDDGLKR